MEDDLKLKMWLAVRRDVTMSLGKAMAQSGHAFGRLYLSASREAPEAFAEYLAENETKITVRAKSEAGLLRVEREARAAGIPCQLVRDAGHTELPPNTATVCAFGPARYRDLPKYLQELRRWEPGMDGADAKGPAPSGAAEAAA